MQTDKLDICFIISLFYIDQPLFADLDLYLRNKQFTLFDLEGLSRYARARSPILSQTHPGQLLWADAFQFRDLLREDIDTPLKTPENILKLACIADILGFLDYALELLEYLTVHYGSEERCNLALPIVESLSRVPELVEQGIDSLPIVMNLQPWLD